MNMNLEGFYDDYCKITKEAHSLEEALSILEKHFNIDETETTTLCSIYSGEIVGTFYKKFITRREQRKRTAMLGLLLDAYFFGMYVGQDYKWDWPKT